MALAIFDLDNTLIAGDSDHLWGEYVCELGIVGLNVLLEKAARDYINHPRGVRVDRSGVTLSSIYNWFASDFELDGGVLGHVRRYASADLRARLEGVETIDGYAYDWSLNDVPSK